MSVFMALFLSLSFGKKGKKTNVCRRRGKAYRSHFPHYSKVSADGTRHRQNGCVGGIYAISEIHSHRVDANGGVIFPPDALHS